MDFKRLCAFRSNMSEKKWNSYDLDLITYPGSGCRNATCNKIKPRVKNEQIIFPHFKYTELKDRRLWTKSFTNQKIMTHLHQNSTNQSVNTKCKGLYGIHIQHVQHSTKFRGIRKIYKNMPLDRQDKVIPHPLPPPQCKPLIMWKWYPNFICGDL